MSPAADNVNEIATVRIELRDSDPPIWREVEVPTSITLQTLHDVVQAAMGWEGCHLWEFTIAKRRYGEPSDEDSRDEPAADAGKTRLREVLEPRKTTIDYMYDFGDGWEHRLTVTNVRAGDPGLAYPQYIGGERNGPPEDCGGIPGFYQMLDAAADPAHPNHAEFEGMAWRLRSQPARRGENQRRLRPDRDQAQGRQRPHRKEKAEIEDLTGPTRGRRSGRTAPASAWRFSDSPVHSAAAAARSSPVGPLPETAAPASGESWAKMRTERLEISATMTNASEMSRAPSVASP